MGRSVRESRLETREARLRLDARAEPYWRSIEGGRHLGYWRGKNRSSWVARCTVGPGKYKEKIIGRADDYMDPDGAQILSFSQAQEKAREWFRDFMLGDATEGPYTVKKAITDYLEWFRANKKSVRDTELRAQAHIVPALGNLDIAALNSTQLRKWLTDLSQARPRMRTGLGKKQQYRQKDDSPDAKRKRRASANRTLTILKAALNQAWSNGKVPTDLQWRRVRPFAKVDVPRVRYLSTDESQRLINACEPDFRKLVKAALLTGARYGELIALRVEDYLADNGLIHIRESKSGKPRHVPLNDEGVMFFDTLTAGRSGNDRLFLRDDGEPWDAGHQQRRLEAAAKVVKLEDVSFHILRHSYGSALAMQGVPLPVIANALGHADTRTTERHYGHLSPSYVHDTVRRNLPKLGISGDAVVERFTAPHSPD